MRHAYLIIAHNDFTILQKLVRQIDDERNDIFIHIDKKVVNFNKENIKQLVYKSKVYFVKNYDVQWGEYSIVKAEISLLKEAYNNNYRYFHLISGTDMILKNQNYIHDFFEINDGYEFLSCATKEHINQIKVIDRFNRFIHIHDEKSAMKKLYMKLFNKLEIDRFKNDFIISYGSAWASITNEFVKYIIDNEHWIKNKFQYSHASDEIYKQCLATNSKFIDKLYLNKQKIFIDLEEKNYKSFNLRYIDWSNGGSHPKILTQNDYKKIIDSKCIFARKFSTEVDEEIIEKIYKDASDSI